ncbi:MAG: hypothetical protein WDO14_19255 [Bacteroidota bacterium]
MDEEMKSSDIRSRLEKLKLDEPSSAFSAVIMKEIEEEPERDPQLQTLLLRHAIEQPSVDFTESVLNRVKGREFKSAIQPVISRKTWAVVIMTFIVLAVAMLFSHQATLGPGLPDYLADLGKRINTFVSGAPLLYLVTFFAVSLLVVGDYVIRMLGVGRETHD